MKLVYLLLFSFIVISCATLATITNESPHFVIYSDEPFNYNNFWFSENYYLPFSYNLCAPFTSIGIFTGKLTISTNSKNINYSAYINSNMYTNTSTKRVYSSTSGYVHIVHYRYKMEYLLEKIKKTGLIYKYNGVVNLKITHKQITGIFVRRK
jgi:hypothetical protein